MYQSLYVTLRTGFRNPRKLELISMINLINKVDPKSTTSVNYLVVDNIESIQSNKVYGIVPNMKLLNYLSSNDYYDSRIDIEALLKQLR